MSTVLILKLVLVPTLIALVTLAGRRWGPSIAGWLSAFPLVAGPILLFIWIEHGPAFTATAAIGTLSAVLANLAFGICYAWAATKHSWPVSLTVGYAGFFGLVACLSNWSPTLYLCLAAVALALLIAPRLYPALALMPSTKSTPVNDIFLRMVAGAVLVILVTHFATRLGPTLSGLFAMFPVMGSVLAVFSHRNYGPGFAVHLLRGMVLGFYAFSTFCAVLALALNSAYAKHAFLLALGAAVLVQALSRLHLRRSTTSNAGDA